MRITFQAPSVPHPVGGVTVLYGFANALARRGHHVNLIHCPLFGVGIESLDDIAWYPFESGVHHMLVDQGERDIPEADIFFGTVDRVECGLPVLLLQGFEMLHTGLERQGFSMPCLKVCVATWLVDVARRLGVPEDQICYVPLGLDRNRYRVTRPIAQRPRRVAMLYSSHRAKGWEVGIEAVARAREEVRDLELSVFGTAHPPGPLPPWVEVFVDPAHEVLVEDIYNRSRVFVQASDHEGFGLTAVEAMACGCALVSTDNGGSRDYARHLETALVTPPRDPESLADAVVTLLTNDEERLRLATAGLRHVDLFDWDRSAELLEGHLEAYLADPDRYRQPYRLAEPERGWTVGSVLG